MNGSFLFRYLAALIFFIPGVLFAQEEKSLELPVPLREPALKAMHAVMLLQYDRALEFAEGIAALDLGVGCVWKNIILISRYDDLGDTLDILKADEDLLQCNARGLWGTLRDFERGYTQSALGHSIKGALNTRAAAKIFGATDDPDALAFFAVYAYYVDQSLSWVPFFSDDREKYVEDLQERALNSGLFWPLFSTSLVWIYYDREEFSKALLLTDQVLLRYPEHPVFLQIRADMLYRLKNYGEAAAIYEKSARDYFERSGPSIRYWCAAMNLVLIYDDMGNIEKRDLWRKKLDDDAFRALKRWLPGSLFQSLKSKKLFP